MAVRMSCNRALQNEINDGLPETTHTSMQQYVPLTPYSCMICRICGKLNDEKKMTPIFCNSVYDESTFNELAAVIQKYLPIQVSAQDKFPLNVCFLCASLLLSWRDLVEMCVKVDEHFKRELQRRNNLSKLEHQNLLNQETSYEYKPQDNESQCITKGIAVNFKMLPNHTEQSSQLANRDSVKQTCSKLYADSNILSEIDISSTNPTEGGKIIKLENLHNQLSSLVTRLVSNIQNHHNENELTIENTSSEVGSEFSFADDEWVFEPDDKTATTKVIESVSPSIEKSNQKKKPYYTCRVCKIGFKSTKSLNQHNKLHKEKSLKCKECSIKFECEDEMFYHLAIDHSCSSTEHKPAFIRHKDKIIDYNEIEKAEVVINGIKYYKCQVCGKNLQRLYSYLTHASIHTGEREYVCHLCGKQFRLSTTLRVHMKYTHEGIKDASCDLCGKQFATRKNMIQHRRIHTGERPYVCQECGKSFKQSASLYIHKRTHTDVFPFECGQCNTRYRIRSQLKYHMIKHTGENPFPCDVCGKACATMSHLNYHKKCAHIKGKPFRCTECDKAFRQKKYLRQHIKCCHKL